MSHFYDKDGNLINGDLRIAKKLNLFPSVTTILGIVEKYGLTQWRIRNGIMSALTLPRNEGETDDDFATRIMSDSTEISKKAASRGTEVHDMIEKITSTGAVYDDPICDAINEFMTENECETICAEKSFVNGDIGIACRIDWFGKTNEGYTLIDWKTQDVKKGKFAKYDEWAYQLAGNYLCMTDFIKENEFPIDAFWNVIVSVNADNYGEIEIVRWSREDIIKYVELFISLRNAYRIIKNL